MLGDDAISLFKSTAKTKSIREIPLIDYNLCEEAIIRISLIAKNKLKPKSTKNEKLNKTYEIDDKDNDALENLIKYMNIDKENTKFLSDRMHRSYSENKKTVKQLAKSIQINNLHLEKLH